MPAVLPQSDLAAESGAPAPPPQDPQLPTMGDLEALAASLDEVDRVLAELDSEGS